MSSEVVTNILFASVTFLVIACADPDDPCDYSQIEQCHNEQRFDSVKTANALIGKWRWEYMLNCSNVADGGKNTAAYSGHSIEFKSDGTFVLNRPNSTSYFQWRLDSIPFDGRIVVDPNRGGAPPHESLWGRLRVCGDRLLANASYRDGSDNFFVKE